jgi:hypothetical protein
MAERVPDVNDSYNLGISFTGKTSDYLINLATLEMDFH